MCTLERLQQLTHVFETLQNLKMDEQRLGGSRPVPNFGRWKFGKFGNLYLVQISKLSDFFLCGLEWRLVLGDLSIFKETCEMFGKL